MNLSELGEQCRRIADELPSANAGTRQVLALAEAVGRVTGSFRAANGLHQHDGGECLARDLASLVITAFVAAAALDIDLAAAVDDELMVVFARTDWQPHQGRGR